MIFINIILVSLSLFLPPFTIGGSFLPGLLVQMVRCAGSKDEVGVGLEERGGEVGCGKKNIHNTPPTN